MPGAFNQPKDVAFDSVAIVYVADNKNHHILVFTEEGVFITSFGLHGTQRECASMVK